MLTDKPKRIYLSSPHMSGNEQHYINQAFETNWVAPLGPNIDAFEEKVATYTGIKSAAAVSSGTAAIHLALLLLNVQRDDVVFCPSFTFIASANPVRYIGASTVFIDSEPDTWNMSPQALERALEDAKKANRLPKAVIIVHLYGLMAKMTEIMSICNRYDVPVIEDAAESLGSTYNGKQSGSFGKLGIFSFNGNKIITTSGGGMLVSDDEKLIHQAKYLATQARDVALHYQHSCTGYNYRMSNVLAGIGRAQMEVIDQRILARRAIYEHYEQSLAGIEGVSFLSELEGSCSNRWLSTMLVDKEITGITHLQLLERLADANIEARPLWKPLHLQPVYEGAAYYSHEPGRSVCEELFASGLCLPSGSNMSVHDQERVIDCLKEGLVASVREDVQSA
ncbi:aminotransferase class I/II-fold pyridoxal phosphate-dependent enzyme [Paenibacillus sp. IITD108]|uniref:aminotransferase class I/II-fold pyridoxal phosphate-dependent enzyme n=1 Tax=Paenibacillus sp. IITD108 TaxID=3116649 RepID=UPI002F41FC04